MEYVGVAGHNAIVPGAYGCGYAEHTVARQMLAKVIEYMEAVGETMHNCTDDAGRTPSSCWQNAVSNTNRSIGSNGLAVSIHLNAATGNASGVEVLHYNNSGLAAKVSVKIAAVLGIRDRGPKDGKPIGYINSTKAEAILIELCFIDNPSDMKKLMDNFDAVAMAIVEAITGKTVQSLSKQESYRINIGDFNELTWAGDVKRQVKELFPNYGLWDEKIEDSHRLYLGDFNSKEWADEVLAKVKEVFSGYGSWIQKL